MKANELEENIRIYSDKKGLYESFCLKLNDLLTYLINEANIPYHIIESRVKSVESFKEKLQREGKNYKKPLDEITDFVGLRIILYYPKDIDTIVGIIKEEFLIDTKNSIDKKKLLKDNEVGYLSVHQVISVKGARSKLPEWKTSKKLKAEIQVRTVLQHTWASISHTLQYKREIDIPTQFRRRLNRLAGLLELADEEFESLKFEQNELELKISKSIEEKDLDLPIDYLTVDDYLKKSDINRGIKNYIESKKNTILDIEDDEKLISQIILVLSHFGIKTIKTLDKLLIKNKDQFINFFENLMPVEEGSNWVGSSGTFLIIFLMGLLKKNKKDLKELYEKLEWVDSFLLDEISKSNITTANNGNRCTSP